MSNRTATLYLRVTTKDGQAPFCKPVYLSKGRLKPHYAIVNRRPEHHPEGVYYVRFGRRGRKQKAVQPNQQSDHSDAAGREPGRHSCRGQQRPGNSVRLQGHLLAGLSA